MTSQRQPNKREVIVFRRKTEWLWKSVSDIVEQKKEMGFQTSFSYEFIRLAQNGLLNEMKGESLDKQILKEKESDN